ncbi:MAG: 1-deoxy-D-xylulose 5-phosphate reductoisomerase [Firmicutes bacterium]|nr:1-deoxy-D-xylulose 5-phosphate reductoisomerase [Bacillota bacterium]
MLKRLAVLGSTGSIGTQTLKVVAEHPEKFKITALAAYHNDKLLENQLEIFQPDIAVLVENEAAERLKKRYRGRTKILSGEEGLLAVATHNATDIVLTAMVGFAGLKPTIAAIEAGKNIALANKETLVAAGEIVTKLAKEKGVAILPVDSEHSAIWQCLAGQHRNDLSKIILTASGGPFRGYSTEELSRVTVESCLRHPTWSMGKKITVDSATLANKGLEVIEAKWLFDVTYDQIDVVVHPQSIIHSMIELNDGAVLAQLGLPDMRVPIQYALSYPGRILTENNRIDFSRIGTLTFVPPDTNVFSALDLAFAAGRSGGTMPCVFNAANEVAVYAFLAGNISFVEITTVIQHIMYNHKTVANPTINEIFDADEWARHFARKVIDDLK